MKFITVCLFLIDPDGANLRLLVKSGRPYMFDWTNIDWLPDGSGIVFGSSDSRLFVVSHDGRKITTIWDSGDPSFTPHHISVSPRGDFIAFGKANIPSNQESYSVWVANYNATTGMASNARKLIDGSRGIYPRVWLPDGTLSIGDGRIVNMAGVTVQDLGSKNAVAMSVDGTRLYLNYGGSCITDYLDLTTRRVEPVAPQAVE